MANTSAITHITTCRVAKLRSKLGHELVSILVLPRVQFVKRRFDLWQFAQLQCVQPRSHWERHVTRKSLNQMLNKIVNAVWSLFNGSKSVVSPCVFGCLFGIHAFLCWCLKAMASETPCQMFNFSNRKWASNGHVHIHWRKLKSKVWGRTCTIAKIC